MYFLFKMLKEMLLENKYNLSSSNVSSARKKNNKRKKTPTKNKTIHHLIGIWYKDYKMCFGE
jgi:hypothetical protein